MTCASPEKLSHTKKPTRASSKRQWRENKMRGGHRGGGEERGGRPEVGVGGSGEKVVDSFGAGVAAATAKAEAAAGVSGNLVMSKTSLAEKAPNECQAGLRRSQSEKIAAGVERAGRPIGGNRKANEVKAPVTRNAY